MMVYVDKKNIPGPECGRTTPPTLLVILPVVFVGMAVMFIVVVVVVSCGKVVAKERSSWSHVMLIYEGSKVG